MRGPVHNPLSYYYYYYYSGYYYYYYYYSGYYYYVRAREVGRDVVGIRPRICFAHATRGDEPGNTFTTLLGKGS